MRAMLAPACDRNLSDASETPKYPKMHLMPAISRRLRHPHVIASRQAAGVIPCVFASLS
jgi:hypothetical protein